METLENIIVCSLNPSHKSAYFFFSCFYKVSCFQFCVVMFALLPKLSFSKGEVILLFSSPLKQTLERCFAGLSVNSSVTAG